MICHFWTSYEPSDPAARERQRVARITWSTQLWTELPVRDSDLPRLWEEEGRRYPYVRDLFDFAARGRADRDILAYTNADICVSSDCALQVARLLQSTDALYAMRRDFNHDFHEPIPDDVIPRGDAYVGSDFYACRAGWWRRWRDEFPDMIVALEAWDAVLRHLIEFTNPGRAVSLSNVIYHRRHSSFWEAAENRYRLRGQKMVLQLAAAWLRRHNINPAIHGIPA